MLVNSQTNKSNCQTPINVTPIHKLSSSSSKIKKLTATVEQHRDSGFIEAVSSSILSLNDEEPNPVVARKPPLGPPKVSMTPTSTSHHGRSFDDSGIGIQEREHSFNNSTSTENSDEKSSVLNRRGTAGPSQTHVNSTNYGFVKANVNTVNTVLFNNDENSLMNSKEISMAITTIDDEFRTKNK